MLSMARFAFVRKLLVRSKSMDEVMYMCLDCTYFPGRQRNDFAAKVMRMRFFGTYNVCSVLIKVIRLL